MNSGLNKFLFCLKATLATLLVMEIGLFCIVVMNVLGTFSMEIPFIQYLLSNPIYTTFVLIKMMTHNILVLYLTIKMNRLTKMKDVSVAMVKDWTRSVLISGLIYFVVYSVVIVMYSGSFLFTFDWVFYLMVYVTSTCVIGVLNPTYTEEKESSLPRWFMDFLVKEVEEEE